MRTTSKSISTSLRSNNALAAPHASQLCRMLAVKVETRQDFVNAKHSGYTLYQGYFFRQPECMRARQIPANHATYVRLPRLSITCFRF
jgi:c-di-GMP-related signal transduction protein